MTSTRDTQSINRKLAVREDHWCFGCGRQNPIGLKLSFYEDRRTGLGAVDPRAGASGI